MSDIFAELNEKEDALQLQINRAIKDGNVKKAKRLEEKRHKIEVEIQKKLNNIKNLLGA